MSETIMDVRQIMEYLPHRYPFLLVDRVIEIEETQRLVGIKNVSINEHFFAGHFPVKPVMPGVLIVEALAQCTGLLAMMAQPEELRKSLIYYFVGIDKVRFKQVVEPGDQLRLEVDFVKQRSSIWVFNTRASVDGKLAASAQIMCTPRKT